MALQGGIISIPKMDLRKIKKKNKREIRKEVSFTSEEWEEVYNDAEREGLPFATYIRWKLFKKTL